MKSRRLALFATAVTLTVWVADRAGGSRRFETPEAIKAGVNVMREACHGSMSQ